MKDLYYRTMLVLCAALLIAGCSDLDGDIATADDDVSTTTPQLVQSITGCSEQGLLDRATELAMPETHIAHEERCVVGIYRDEGDGYACAPRYHRDNIGIHYYKSGKLVAAVSGSWYVGVFDDAGNRLVDGSYGLNENGEYTPDDMWYFSYDDTGHQRDLRVDEAPSLWSDKAEFAAVVLDHSFPTFLNHSELGVTTTDTFDTCQRTIYRLDGTAEELPTDDELEGINEDQNCSIDVVHSDENGNVTFEGLTFIGPTHGDARWHSRTRHELTYEDGITVLSQDYRSDWSTPLDLEYEMIAYTIYSYDEEDRVTLIEYWMVNKDEDDRIVRVEEYSYSLIPSDGYTKVVRTDWGYFFDRYEYDSDGREVEHWQYVRDGWPANQVETLDKTKYDNSGHIVEREHYENERYELLDDPHSVPEFPERATTLEYDEQGRLAKETIETRTWWGAIRMTINEWRYICSPAP